MVYGCVWKCRVPLNPMVLLIIIPFLNGYFIGNINPTFSDKPIFHPNTWGITPQNSYDPRVPFPCRALPGAFRNSKALPRAEAAVSEPKSKADISAR